MIRTTASEVEQKFLPPVLLETGVPTTTNSLHGCFWQTALTLNRNPDFVHQMPAAQLAFPSVASMKFAWSADAALPPRGSGPSMPRSRA